MKVHQSSTAVFATSCVLAVSGAIALAIRHAQRLKALEGEQKRREQAARVIQGAWRDYHPRDHQQKALMQRMMLRWKRAIDAQRDRTATRVNAVLKANWELARKGIQNHAILLIQASWYADQKRREESAMSTIEKLFLPAVCRWKLLRAQEQASLAAEGTATTREAAPIKHVSFDAATHNDSDDDSSMNSHDLHLSTPMEKALFPDHQHLSFKHILVLIVLAMAVAFTLIQQNGPVHVVQNNVVEPVKKSKTSIMTREQREVAKDSKDVTWQALPLFFGAK